MGVRPFVEAEQAEEGNVATTCALLEVFRSACDSDRIDSIEVGHGYQHTECTDGGRRSCRELRARLEEIPEVAQRENAGRADRGRT